MNYDEILFSEFKSIFLGSPIGYGAFRTVYNHPLDKTLVIKVESEGGFHNIAEWNLWQDICYSDNKKWFAPCVSISNLGRILVMKKTDRNGIWPDKIPVFFCDVGYCNYGFIDGNFVCHDYGYTNLPELGFSKKTRKVDWEE